MPVMLMSRVSVLPQTSDQIPNTRARAMLPDAGIVVTEMNTPTRPPDFAEVRASTPAAPAMIAIVSDHTLGE